MGIEIEGNENEAPAGDAETAEVIYTAIRRELRRMGFADQMAFAADLRKGRAFDAIPSHRRAAWQRVAAAVQNNE